VSKAHQSESAFNATLAERLRGASATGTPAMHMNAAPTGPSKSLEDLLNVGEPAGAAPATPTAAAPAAAAVATVDSARITRRLPLQDLVDSPYQPRDRYDESELQALGEAMKARGQDEPVVVRPLASGKYELISGHRRTRAARLIGWSEIDARVTEHDERAAHLATLVSNESHVKLSDFERAKAYQAALNADFATDQKGIATLFGCSQGRVSQCLSLFKLPKPILDFMDKYPSLVGYRHARVIKDIITRHPANVDDIAAAVEVLIDKPDIDLESFQAWLLKPLQKKRVRTAPIEPRTIADKNGASAFKVLVKERQIVINVEDGVDVEQASRKAMAALRQFAEGLELPKT
jgi:ParB family chromosome partitioning protein